MNASGKLHLVSVGPGVAELIPPMAESALRPSDAIVSYELYLKWITPWIEGKEIHSFPLTRERERATKAIELARAGCVASLVSSGDIGVYAMASLVLEEMREEEDFELQIIPGISAANSCAALLGSPLSHDFATLSLSDLLCPWEWIECRARRLAQVDLVTALYNVQSRTRRNGVYRILRILLEHKSPQTWCGVVRNAYRDGEEHYVCTLSELLDQQFDMLTTIIVGNRFTRRKRQFIYTPRGYNSWEIPREQESAPAATCPSVWVFSGTSDGNALASELAGSGHDVIVSAASEYGQELVAENFPGLVVRSGKIGHGSPPPGIAAVGRESHRRCHASFCNGESRDNSSASPANLAFPTCAMRGQRPEDDPRQYTAATWRLRRPRRSEKEQGSSSQPARKTCQRF